jgi:hypothetical protein
MRVLAGPFVGEFGIELCMWHGWLRKLKTQLGPDTDMRVVGFPGHEVLYHDFADSWRGLTEPVDQDLGRGCTNVGHDWYELAKAHADEWLKEMEPGQAGIDLLIPSLVTEQRYLRGTRGGGRNGLYKRLQWEYTGPRLEGLVMVVPRHRINHNREPGGGVEKVNFGEQKWEGLVNWLVDEGYQVVLTGLSTGCCLKDFNHPSVLNRIGYSLNEQVNWMNQAQFGISSYTGVFPLYLQCCLPSICFGPPDGIHHINQVFNPLRTPYRFHGELGFSPPLERVTHWVKEFVTTDLPRFEHHIATNLGISREDYLV